MQRDLLPLPSRPPSGTNISMYVRPIEFVSWMRGRGTRVTDINKLPGSRSRARRRLRSGPRRRIKQLVAKAPLLVSLIPRASRMAASTHAQCSATTSESTRKGVKATTAETLMYSGRQWRLRSVVAFTISQSGRAYVYLIWVGCVCKHECFRIFVLSIPFFQRGRKAEGLGSPLNGHLGEESFSRDLYWRGVVISEGDAMHAPHPTRGAGKDEQKKRGRIYDVVRGQRCPRTNSSVIGSPSAAVSTDTAHAPTTVRPYVVRKMYMGG